MNPKENSQNPPLWKQALEEGFKQYYYSKKDKDDKDFYRDKYGSPPDETSLKKILYFKWLLANKEDPLKAMGYTREWK